MSIIFPNLHDSGSERLTTRLDSLTKKKCLYYFELLLFLSTEMNPTRGRLYLKR